MPRAAPYLMEGALVIEWPTEAINGARRRTPPIAARELAVALALALAPALALAMAEASEEDLPEPGNEG